MSWDWRECSLDSFGSDEGRVGISGGQTFFALLGCCFSLVWHQHCITIELVFSLSLRVCLSDDLFKTLYSVCFAAANKYYKLVGMLQMHYVCVVVCWRWCWSRLCQIWGTLRGCLCPMCLLCSASSDCFRTSCSPRALTIKHYGVRRWGMDGYVLTLIL